MSRARILSSGLVSLACLLGVARASAQVDLGAFARALSSSPLLNSSPSSLSEVFAAPGSGGVRLVLRAKSGVPSAPDLTSLGTFAVGALSPERVLALSSAHPDWSFDWAPPRHVLLDKVDGWVHAASVRKQTQTSGQGVVVGIVDNGVELAHKDLQTAEHKTRVAWLMDVSREPANLHGDLEKAYGCIVPPMSPGYCAIYDASDIDALLTNKIVGDEPGDFSGHGTHVASLAAGNGLSNPVPTYVGIAPEATYVVVRVADSQGGIVDSDILRGVQFIFDRATELGMPAVVNLSLGSDFGAHDGSSALEVGLTSMVGPDFPGRAIVVAAGNSAGLYRDPGFDSAYPGPFGVHTEVHVPRDSVSRVPLLTPAIAGPQVTGDAYVWIDFREGDDLAVGLDDKDGPWIPLVKVGQATTYKRGGLKATIYNGATGGSSDAADSVGAARNSAVIWLTGNWPASSDFAIRLEGHGTAECWVQGTGDLDPEIGYGALFPRAEKQGTINVPASASGLIAVGATLNRTSWVDATGANIDMASLGALEDAPLDTIAYFSSGGPNALGVIKPDIVAPGVAVVGAMAHSADPRSNDGMGLFASFGRCPTMNECFVVDDDHAVTSGTSMSAPIVSGAIALLFERDPTLSQDAVRAILQAGARPLQGIVGDERQIGPGALDLQGALSVATAGDSPALRIPGMKSWLALSESYVHPDPAWLLNGYVELRDDAENIADGFDARRLKLATEPAALIRQTLTRVAAGFYRFALSAPPETGGGTQRIQILFDDQPIITQSMPIAVDRWVAEEGVSARGGCAVAARCPTTFGSSAALALAFASLWRRRGRRRHMLAR